jgi:SulP family sulfate permease
LRRVPKAPRAGVVMMVVVMGLTVFVDLIVAVGVGIVAASLLFVKRMSDLQLDSVRGGHDEVPLSKREKRILARHGNTIMYYHMSGPMGFGAAKGLTRRVAVDSKYKILVLDLSEVTFVDTSASMAIEEIMVKADEQGLEVFLVGLVPQVRAVLDRLEVTKIIPPHHVFDDRKAAIKYAEKLIDPTRATAAPAGGGATPAAK